MHGDRVPQEHRKESQGIACAGTLTTPYLSLHWSLSVPIVLSWIVLLWVRQRRHERIHSPAECSWAARQNAGPPLSLDMKLHSL